LNDPQLEPGGNSFEIIQKFNIPSGIDNSTLLKNIMNGSIPSVNGALSTLEGPSMPNLADISNQMTSNYDNLGDLIHDTVLGNNSGTLFTIADE
jgi:hypothetical protein